MRLLVERLLFVHRFIGTAGGEGGGSSWLNEVARGREYQHRRVPLLLYFRAS